MKHTRKIATRAELDALPAGVLIVTKTSSVIEGYHWSYVKDKQGRYWDERSYDAGQVERDLPLWVVFDPTTDTLEDN